MNKQILINKLNMKSIREKALNILKFIYEFCVKLSFISQN